MTKFHLALNVRDIATSVRDYTTRFQQEPDLVIPGEYALWRTETLNISIRNTPEGGTGTLRHLGWECSEAVAFQAVSDSNCILWEEFTAEQQAREIEDIWPGTGYQPRT